MAKHKQFQNIPIGWCGCYRGDFFEPMRSMVGRYEPGRVEIVCSDCDGVAASFYRTSEIDDEPTKADKALIGQTVQVKRFVAWVGYAKNTGTVFWSEKDERAKKAQILVDATGISFEKADIAVNGYGSIFWLDRAANRHARYLLFRRAFASSPVLPTRGLWFMDAERTVMISGVLRCLTGYRVAGSSSGDAFDGCAPPELDNRIHHQLYYGYSDDGQRALVYPGDCYAAQQTRKK